MKKLTKFALSAAVGLSLVIGGGAVAANAASTPISGTLNCNGSSNSYFNNERKTTQPGQVQFQLGQSAGSQYGSYITYLGAYVVAENSYKPKQATSIQSPYAYLMSNAYVVGTRFTLYGSMAASNGTCYNTFSGTLYY